MHYALGLGRRAISTLTLPLVRMHSKGYKAIGLSVVYCYQHKNRQISRSRHLSDW